MFGLKTRHIFFILVLVAAIYAGTQLFPVYFRAYQFSDYVYQEVKFAESNRKTFEKIRSEILIEAKDSDIPIKARDIHITPHGPTFTLEIDYQLPVDLYFYQRQISFHVNDSGTSFENDRN